MPMPRAHWIFLLASAWMGLEHAALGPFSAFHIHDTADVSSMALDAGGVYREADLWLPWVAGGVDRLANDLTRTHLTSLLFMALPGWLAYETIFILQFFLFSYFVHRLARDRLGMEELPATFAALAAMVYMEAYPSVLKGLNPDFKGAFALLPMMLWQLEKADDASPRTPWLRVVGLGLLNGACSSLPRALPFCFAAVAVWFAVVRGKTSLRFWSLFLVFCLVSALPQSRTALAMALHGAGSHRADWAAPASSWASSLRQVWANLLLYKMLLGLTLAGWALAGRSDPLLRRLLAAFLLWASLAEAGENLKPHLPGPLGFLKGFRFEKSDFLLPMFAAFAGAQGLGRLPRRSLLFGLGAAVLFALSVQLKAVNIAEWYFWGGYAANYSSPVYRDLASRREDPFRVATFTHGLNPSYANAYGLETVDGYLNIYPKAYQRFWSKVIGPLTSQDAYYDEFFNRSGNKVYLFLRDAEPFVAGGLPFSRFYRLPLLSLANAKYLISRIPLLHDDLKPIRVPAPWPGERKERLKLRLRENFSGKTHLYVYENTSALPRAFLVRKARFFPDREALLQQLAGAAARELRDTVFLEESFSKSVGPGPFEPGKVSFSAYHPDRIELRLETAGPALLVVSNTFNPYWRCEADGVEKEIVPAFGAFWAVRLASPARNVTFRYDPPYRMF
ncbi:MAG: hypothetical protein HY748_14240 [Elusimicrobia bacterium]|nr:hypothetical protein [Elusimicrobiota bacterium]